MVLSVIQHLQPQITLQRADILLSWDGRMLHSVELLMLILLYASRASSSPPSSVVLTMLL